MYNVYTYTLEVWLSYLPTRVESNRGAHQYHLGPTWQPVDQGPFLKQTSPKEYQEIRQGNGNFLYGRMDKYRPPRGPSRICNSMVPPRGDRQHPVPFKCGRKYRVSYESTGENKFLVYMPKGKISYFTNARGVSSNPSWIQGRRCLSILYIIIYLSIPNATTLGL